MVASVVRDDIYRVVADISAGDGRERSDQADVLAWIKNGEPIFRLEKPDKPAKHLVSYFVPVDLESKALLLFDHKKSGLWLPPGGHVEPNEDPVDTVRREMQEELFMPADFSTPIGSRPCFLTVTRTRGEGSHTDVSLWYIVAMSGRQEITYDPREFSGYRWLTFEEVGALPADTIDPEMHRFTAKLIRLLEEAEH